GVLVSSYFAHSAGQEATAARAAEKEALDAKGRADDEAKAARKAEKEATAANALAGEQKNRAEAQLRRAGWLVYGGERSLAQNRFAEGNVELAVQHLDECQWDLRGWEHRHLWTRFDSKQTFRGHADPVVAVAFSADCKRILTGSEDKTAKVWDAEKGQQL